MKVIKGKIYKEIDLKELSKQELIEVIEELQQNNNIINLKNMENYKVGDKVVKDIKFYDTKLKGKHLDFEVITKIGISNGIIEEINGVVCNIYRKATKEEIKLYYN